MEALNAQQKADQERQRALAARSAQEAAERELRRAEEDRLDGSQLP